MAPLLQLCLLWRCGRGEGTVNAERGRILGGDCVGLNHVVGRGLPLSYIHDGEFTTKETIMQRSHETCTRGHCPRSTALTSKEARKLVFTGRTVDDVVSGIWM